MMKGNAIIYGNCQHTHLERFLRNSHFCDYFNILSVKDVYCKDKSLLDNDNLSKLDIFIYQHVSKEFDDFFCTDRLLSLLKPTCIKICIPNFWFTGYWPNYIKNPVIRRCQKFSISPSGLFPYGDNKVIELLQKGYSANNILQVLSEDNLVSDTEIKKCLSENYTSMKQREEKFDVKYSSAEYEIANFQNKRICYTVNHPTREYFLWLTKNILKDLSISSHELDDFDYRPFLTGHIHTPIYPSIIKQCNLKWLSPDPDVKQYRFYDELISFNEYYTKYIDHSVCRDVPGKDNIDWLKWSWIQKKAIVPIQCNETHEQYHQLKELYDLPCEIDPSKNYIILNNKVTEFGLIDKDSVPGLKINCRGYGNIIKIENNVRFTESNLSLGKRSYVCFKHDSVFGDLKVENRFHSGGTCVLGSNILAPNKLRIFLYGNNKCIIGDECIFADNVSLLCSDGHTILSSDNDILNQNGNIYIGRKNWLGMNSIILKNSFIGQNNVIGCNSVISRRRYGDNLLIAGSPARILKSNIHWNISNPEHMPLTR